jgi:hypothetical protein
MGMGGEVGWVFTWRRSLVLLTADKGYLLAELVGSRFPRRIAYSTQSRGQGCCNSKRACDRMEASCGFFFFGHWISVATVGRV